MFYSAHSSSCISSFPLFVCVFPAESRYHEHSNEGHLQCVTQKASGSMLFSLCHPCPFKSPQDCIHHHAQGLHQHHHFIELFLGQSLEVKGECYKRSVLRSSHVFQFTLWGKLFSMNIYGDIQSVECVIMSEPIFS